MVWTREQKKTIRKIIKWRPLVSQPRGRFKTKMKGTKQLTMQNLWIKEQRKKIKIREEQGKILQEARRSKKLQIDRGKRVE